MSGTFVKFVLPSLLASGAVFTALSLPLVVYGAERVDLHLTDDLKVSGVVSDFSAPYLGLSGLVSLAVGGVGLTLAGLDRSKKKSAILEKQYLESQEALKGRDAEIQSILMSGKGLTNSGLAFFLDDMMPVVQSATTAATIAIAPTPAPVTQSTAPVSAAQPAVPVSVPEVAVPEVAPVAAAPIAVAKPAPSFSVSSTIAGIQPVKVPQVTVQTSISPMPAAHGFLGFMRSSQSVPSAAIAWLEEVESAPQTAVQLQDLQSQMQVLMGQIEQLQSSLQPQPVAAAASRIEVITQSEMPKNKVAPHRFQPFEHAWGGAPQRLAS
jgi:hypothetical protein